MSIRPRAVRLMDGAMPDEIHDADLYRRTVLDRSRAGALPRRVDTTRASPQGERAVSGHRPAAPRRGGYQRAGARRKTAGHRWAIRGNPRTTRRLLPDR